MKTEIEILTAQLQSEYDFLRSQLEAAIEECDFFRAVSLHKSIQYTMDQLQTLMNISDPNILKIDFLEKKINILNQLIAKESSTEIPRKVFLNGL